MRKRGEYIIDKRLKFKRGLQKKFIEMIKENSNLSWGCLANKINVCSYTLRIDWRQEKSTMPYGIAASLLREYPFEKFKKIKSEWVDCVLSENWGQKLGGIRSGRREIKTPAKSEELAEILAVILGDGHLGKKELTITSARHEIEHLQYIRRKLKKLFNVDSKLFFGYTNENTLKLDCYSSELIGFLTNNGLRIGNKIRNKASFPKWVSTRKEFIFGALRGLFDTDGGLYQKQRGYNRAIIEFQTHSPAIRRDIISLLKKAGFNPSKSLSKGGFTKKMFYNVRIQNQEDVHRFFRLVGSSNPKNIVRYNHFIKTGTIPLKEDLYKEIVEYRSQMPFRARL